MIKALIFDFDGLILETERPDYEAWRQTLEPYGVEFPLAFYTKAIGSTLAQHGADPFVMLEQHLGQPVNRQAVLAEHDARVERLLASQPILPGVEAVFAEARRMGLKLAVASSSPAGWVFGHLKRLGLLDNFDVIKTSDDVEQVKPDPALFVAALDALKIKAHEAIVFEDSPNGVTAAKRAGIFAVAVPTELTAPLDLSRADLKIESLVGMPLEQIIVLGQSGHSG